MTVSGCKPLNYGPKEAFRDYGNNSFFLTDAGKYPNLRMEFESLHLGMYDGFTGLFYPENEEIKDNQRIKARSGTKILAVAGFPMKIGMKMEVMDPSDPEFNCKNLPDFPDPTNFAIGGIISNDTIHIESGMPTLPKRIPPRYVPRYQLKKSKGRIFEEWRWERISPQTEPTYFIGSGSATVFKKEVPSLEQALEMVSNETNPMLKELKKYVFDLARAFSSYQHCNIKINETTFMVTGGFNYQITQLPTSTTLFINVETGEQVVGPPLNISRFNHGCEKVLINGKPVLIVVGGNTGKLQLTKSVEYLELSSLKNGWKKATDLPFALGGPKLVTSMDKSSMYALGGYILKTSKGQTNPIYQMIFKNNRFIEKKINMGILQFECQTMKDCKWNVLEKRPTYPRVNGVAIAIPDSFADSICKSNPIDDFWIKLKESLGQYPKRVEEPLKFLETLSKHMLN